MAEDDGVGRLYLCLGNTSLQVGGYRGGWVLNARVPAPASDDAPAWRAALGEALAGAAAPWSGALLCSSTPRSEALALSLALEAVTGLRPRRLGHEVTVPLPVAYDDPATYGQDRLLVCFAAARLVGAPCVVLDAGTCLTCDAVTTAGTVLPVGIAAGLPALTAGLQAATPHLTAALDRALADWRRPAVAPARSTAGSLRAGLRAALGGTAERLVGAALEALSDAGATLVVTGGDGPALAGLLSRETLHLPDLALEGLRLLDEMPPTHDPQPTP
jgi:type III pantothenate kinase